MYFSSALYSHPQGKRMPRPGTGLVLAVCYANEGTWQGQGDKRHSLSPPPQKRKIKAINLKPHKLHSGSRAGTHSAQALGRHQVVRRSNCLWPALDFST